MNILKDINSLFNYKSSQISTINELKECIEKQRSSNYLTLLFIGIGFGNLLGMGACCLANRYFNKSFLLNNKLLKIFFAIYCIFSLIRLYFADKFKKINTKIRMDLYSSA